MDWIDLSLKLPILKELIRKVNHAIPNDSSPLGISSFEQNLGVSPVYNLVSLAFGEFFNLPVMTH